RGSADFVRVDQPVINQYGLIGRVRSTTPRFATVQLLTDPANRVAGRIERSREMGIVRYLPGRGMILDNFPIFGDIAVGDTVVSSGLGGIYPEGLVVGVVTDVHRGEHAAFADVAIDPAVNFQSIEELFLLRTEGRP
ncbi:MAG TPA: rod shape-determining protein MreC, partial [candidate division Zixibacteria bacterium]|nr:rod shape-determining protein MreC [candidate division Zixibacteria bacterium]